MTNKAGFNTSAIFGFTRILLEMLNKEKPTHIGIAFDPEGETFRHLMAPDYKANRKEAPDIIKESAPIIKEIVEAFNIPAITIPGYEADDIIGTLAKKAEKKGFVTYMMTPDKDYGQLVSENILIFKPNRIGKGYDKFGVQDIKKRYGIEDPMQVVDILALWGDSSDNISGAPGIGEKTAMKLVAQYGSIENIIAHSNELKGRTQESIQVFADQIERSKRLVTIDLNVPVEFNEELLKFKEPNKELLLEIFTDLDFKTFIREICGNVQIKSKPVQAQQGSLFDPIPIPAPVNEKKREEVKPIEASTNRDIDSHFKTITNTPHKYHIAQTTDEVQSLANILEQQSSFAISIKSDEEEPMLANTLGIAFAVKSHEAWYVPIKEDNNLLNILRKPLEDEKIAKIGHNLKFDYIVLKRAGINLQGKLLDVMLEHYLLQPELKHNLEYLAETTLEYAVINQENILPEKKARLSAVSLDEMKEYAGESVDICLQIHENIVPQLKESELQKLYDTIEGPLVRVLADMEYDGVNLDIDELHGLGSKIREDLKVLENEIREMAGDPELNVYSPKQLGETLFEKMQLTAKARTTSKTKQYSTSEETLMFLYDKHPIIGKILELRSIKKLLSSYIEILPTLVNSTTNRIHTSFNQAVTATGRLSSNNPNLQNIPIREERGREIRKAFISSDSEHLLLSADYSQVELRIMAHLSNDTDMVSAFLNNEDIHTATAAKIFHVSPDEVTKEQRYKAKTANFGIIYGISVHGLSQRLHIPRAEAKKLIDGYFVAYPHVRRYMDNAINTAHSQGFAETLYHRRRILSEINLGNAMQRAFAERNAINAPIQGSAADIIKLAMIKIHNRLNSENLKSRMILQVHDELVLDVFKPELDKVKALVLEEMENAAKLRVPLTAEAGAGKNWFEAH
jgi:DNA polymerase-1